MVWEIKWEEYIMQLQKLGILTFLGLFPRYHKKKEARLTLHWRAHLYVEADFDSEHFQFLTCHYCKKLGLLTEVEFLSGSNIGLISYSKLKFRDKDQSFWLARTPGKSNPNLTSDQKNPKILKLVVLVHSLYLDIGEGLEAKM